jgi:hypothetical protein
MSVSPLRGDEASAVMIVRSLEDSLAHWRTIDSCDAIDTPAIAGHQ